MIPKLIWTLIGLNTTALLIVVILFLASLDGRHVDTMEKGWTVILFVSSIAIILLAAVPLYFSQSTASLAVSAFFATLPLLVGLSIWASNYLPSLKPQPTRTELYYTDKGQRTIADAIEKGDSILLQTLIEGQDLTIQGNRVWGWDGLTYLQFAVRLRSNADFTFNEQGNRSTIRLLLEKGAAPTPALAEGVKKLPPELIALLLDAGADPNTTGFVNADPLLFSAVGPTKQENDIAILLVRQGANADAKNGDGLTPLMFAATNASTSGQWLETWRFIRYLLEEAHADYTYTQSNGNNFGHIISSIELKAEQESRSMGPDFKAVVNWLNHHKSALKEPGGNTHERDGH